MCVQGPNQRVRMFTYVSQKFVTEPLFPIGQNASVADADDSNLAVVVCRLIEAVFAEDGLEFLIFNTAGTSVQLNTTRQGRFDIIYTMTGGQSVAEYSQVCLCIHLDRLDLRVPVTNLIENLILLECGRQLYMCSLSDQSLN